MMDKYGHKLIILTAVVLALFSLGFFAAIADLVSKGQGYLSLGKAALAVLSPNPTHVKEVADATGEESVAFYIAFF
jgi:hypothetical protein